MRNLAVIASLVVFGASGSPGAAKENVSGRCLIEKAVYRSSGKDGLSLSFARVPVSADVMNNVVLHLYSQNKTVERWYFFDAGSARRVALISASNPMELGWNVDSKTNQRYGNMTFIAVDKTGNISENPPKPISEAPSSIIIPELSEALRKDMPAYSSATFQIVTC